MKCLKQLSVTMPWEEHKVEYFFSDPNVETSVEDCEHAGHPSTSDTGENVEKVSKIINKE
jgi:hypothetical protein